MNTLEHDIVELVAKAEEAAEEHELASEVEALQGCAAAAMETARATEAAETAEAAATSAGGSAPNAKTLKFAAQNAKLLAANLQWALREQEEATRAKLMALEEARFTRGQAKKSQAVEERKKTEGLEDAKAEPVPPPVGIRTSLRKSPRKSRGQVEALLGPALLW